VPLDYVSTSPPSGKRRKRIGNDEDEDEFALNGAQDSAESYISVDEAIYVVRDPSVPTRADQHIQTSIRRKIGG
jgi:hypothetical protein